MAVLRRCHDHCLFEWQLDTVIGLGHDGEMALGWHAIATHHAALAWCGRLRVWQLHDLGGGVVVDGRSIAPGAPGMVGRGARVWIGDCELEVVDDSPPPVFARAVEGLVALGVDGVLALPEEHAPTRMVLRERSGWVMRPAAFGAGAAVAVGDGEPCLVAGRRWQIGLPPTTAESSRWLSRLVACRLDLVRGAAGFDAVLRTGARWASLPARAHHALLWALAQARRADAGRPVEAQGWRPAATVLGAGGAARVAVMVERAVRQLAAQGVIDAARLFEVRGEALRLWPDGLDVRLLGRAAADGAPALPDGG